MTNHEAAALLAQALTQAGIAHHYTGGDSDAFDLVVEGVALTVTVAPMDPRNEAFERERERDECATCGGRIDPDRAEDHCTTCATCFQREREAAFVVGWHPTVEGDDIPY